MSSGILDKLVAEDVLVIGSNIQEEKGFLNEKRNLLKKHGEDIVFSYKGSALENLISVIITEDKKIVELEDKFERFGKVMKTHTKKAIEVDEIAKNAVREE